jgi:predicted HicB family RNase H-like nuclease
MAVAGLKTKEREPMPQVQLNTRISVEVFEALDKAAEKGISKAQIVEEALRMHPRVQKYLKEE